MAIMGPPPPTLLLFIPPLPPSYEPPPTPRRHPPPPPSQLSSNEAFILFLVVSFVLSLLGLFVYGMLKGHRNGREAAAVAEVTARPPRPWPRALPQVEVEPTRHFEELRRLRQARAASPAAARLPAFKYNQSVKRKVAGGGEEAATCSVCLGAFQLGETVRLLPVCLHLYHVECIDPWLDGGRALDVPDLPLRH